MCLARLVGACAAALLFALPAIAQPQVVNTEDMIRLAMERNQEYLALRERVSEAQALSRQAGLRPSPTLEIAAGVGAITGSHGESEYSAAYFHTFERGGKREKRVAVAEKGIELAQAEIDERARELAFDVKGRAIAVLEQQLKLGSIRSILTNYEESRTLTTRRVALGDAAPLEEQLLLAEMNRIRAQIVAVEAAKDAGDVDLRSIVGLATPVDLRDNLKLGDREPTLDELKAFALQHRPDLKTLALLEEQSAAELRLADAEGRRDLTASARYTRSSSRFDQLGFGESGGLEPLHDTDNIITFGVSIPLTSKNRAQPSIDAARSRQNQQTLRRANLTRVIPQEVEAAYRRWIGARRSLDVLRTGVVEPSQRSLTIMREAYRLGQLRVLDVLNEQRRLVDLELQVIDTQADVARALAELERALGGNLP